LIDTIAEMNYQLEKWQHSSWQKDTRFYLLAEIEGSCDEVQPVAETTFLYAL
jgi:hypothetical protein